MSVAAVARFGVSANPLDSGCVGGKVVSMNDWDRLAQLLLEAAGDEVAERGCPIWVRVLDPPDGDREKAFALALSDEPDGLLGWVATPDCQAVGLVATGRLRALPGAPAGAIDPGRDRLRLACLVTRHGEVVTKMALPDGTGNGLSNYDAPSEGRMLDSLRRCFELRTPPPPVGPGRLQAVAWLVAILEHGTAASRQLSWSDVSRLHPVALALGTDLGGSDAGLLSGLLRLAASAWSWEDLRRQAERDACLADVIDPKLARWMDEGMFARWILSELPSPDELLARVRPYLAPSAARRLVHAVHASGQTEAAGASS
jgi:hypothetical protein